MIKKMKSLKDTLKDRTLGSVKKEVKSRSEHKKPKTNKK